MSRNRINRSIQAGRWREAIVPNPLTLRLDISLRTGEKRTPATRITWVSPGKGARWVKGMEVLLIPN